LTERNIFIVVNVMQMNHPSLIVVIIVYIPSYWDLLLLFYQLGVVI